MGDYKFSEQEAIANLIDELKDIYFNNKDKIDKAYEDFLKEGDDRVDEDDTELSKQKED